MGFTYHPDAPRSVNRPPSATSSSKAQDPIEDDPPSSDEGVSTPTRSKGSKKMTVREPSMDPEDAKFWDDIDSTSPSPSPKKRKVAEGAWQFGKVGTPFKGETVVGSDTQGTPQGGNHQTPSKARALPVPTTPSKSVASTSSLAYLTSTPSTSTPSVTHTPLTSTSTLAANDPLSLLAAFTASLTPLRTSLETQGRLLTAAQKGRDKKDSLLKAKDKEIVELKQEVESLKARLRLLEEEKAAALAWARQ